MLQRLWLRAGSITARISLVFTGASVRAEARLCVLSGAVGDEIEAAREARQAQQACHELNAGKPKASFYAAR